MNSAMNNEYFLNQQNWLSSGQSRVSDVWCAMGCILQILAKPRIMWNQKNISGNFETLQMNCLQSLSEKAKTTCREVKGIY